ncbi:MAG TPA: non-homologous end-joining DNA ligase [Verrucomicrobiales bacterium]|nr:non-homologous end-joining DNA ligase [Verrucomicrobiales bacterium]
MPSKATTLDIEGTAVAVTNLDKVFYPATGFTKGDVIDYYLRIAPVLLPHLSRRPISLKRYPDGVEGMFFYEKQCPSHRPKWMKTARVAKKEGGSVDYCVLDDLPSLVWAANMADLELHTFLHRAPALQRPTAVAFDLDPGPPADIHTCCRVAMELKKLLDSLELESFPKTSGSKGLQVYVPLNTAIHYDRTKAFARIIAGILEERLPEIVISHSMSKNLRKGKVFVDWSQNDDKKTTVTVYSLRAKEHPTVSTPLLWKEVNAAASREKALSFTSDTVLRRVKKQGDLFAPVLTIKQKLPSLKSLTATS